MHTINNIHLQNNDVLHMRNEDLDEILRGEISAVEAYGQVIEKVSHDPEVFRLEQFKEDHKRAADHWEKEARISGFIPEQSSSIWGTVVEAFVGLSKLAGEETALKALLKGEEHGLSNYEKMLESDNLTAFHKKEITDVFIPNQQRHINSINAMLKMH